MHIYMKQTLNRPLILYFVYYKYLFLFMLEVFDQVQYNEIYFLIKGIRFGPETGINVYFFPV